MRVEYKNDGSYTGYSLDGTVLSFRGGELTFDLARLQRFNPVKVTISEDEGGNLVTGISRRYVAEVDIPAKRRAAEKTGAVNPFGFPILRRVNDSFDAAGVVLTLWAVR